MREIYVSRHVEKRMREQARRQRWSLAIGLALSAAGTTVGAIMSPFGYAAAALGILVAVAGSTRRRLGPAYRAGVEGEEKLKKHLGHMLGHEFTAFFGIPVANGDIDCVVLGPSTVWAIEVKHLTGDIAYRNGQWSRVRRRGNEAYIEALRSPSAQLIAAVRHLRAYLAAQGISVWITETIVFVGDRCTLSITGLQNITAVKLESLEAPPAGRRLSAEERKSIGEAILALSTPEQCRHVLSA